MGTEHSGDYSNGGHRRSRWMWVAVLTFALGCAFIAGVLVAALDLTSGAARIVLAAGFGAFLLGVLVALAELISRYRDDPARALWSPAAALYVAVNAAASLGAFLLIRAFGWSFGSTGSVVLLTQVLVAGFGSAALFRSSLFNVTAGDQVIGVGPSAVLNVILSAADRAVDRRRAAIRSHATAASMDGISFENGADALSMYCFAAMQNASTDEVRAIEDKISLLRDKKNGQVPDQVKSYVLGLALATVVGDKVLSDASIRLKGLIALPKKSGASTQPLEVLDDGMSADESRVIQLLQDKGPLQTALLQEEAGIELSTFGPLMEGLTERGLILIQGEGDLEEAILA